MVEHFCRSWLQVEVVLQIVFYSFIYVTFLFYRHLYSISEVFHYLALPRFPLVTSDDGRNFGKENCIRINHTHPQEGQDVPYCFQGQGSIVAAQAYLRELFGLFFIQLQMVDAELLDLVFAVEGEEYIPNVVHHFVYALPHAILLCAKHIGFGNALLPIIAEDFLQLCNCRTSRNTLRHTEIELIGQVCLRIAPPLVFAFSCNLLGYLLEVEVWLALPVE